MLTLRDVVLLAGLGVVGFIGAPRPSAACSCLGDGLWTLTLDEVVLIEGDDADGTAEREYWGTRAGIDAYGMWTLERTPEVYLSLSEVQ